MNIEQVEQQLLDRWKNNVVNKLADIFGTRGSQGNNPQKLAKILAAYDIAITVLNWNKEHVANLSHIVSQYQASLDAKYHNDYKEVLIAEEIERRKEERKGVSILAN